MDPRRMGRFRIENAGLREASREGRHRAWNSRCCAVAKLRPAVKLAGT